MNVSMLALIIHEGSRAVTAILRNRSPKKSLSVTLPIKEAPEEETKPKLPPVLASLATEDPNLALKAKSVEAGCVPCAIGHMGTCTGLLNEAIRFAKKDGVGVTAVIDRVNICLDELNAMERIDLRPELIVNLSVWEKELANKALQVSRVTRHGLEAGFNVNELESVAASMQSNRQDIGRTYFKHRLKSMSDAEKTEMAKKVIKGLVEEEEEDEED